MTDRPQQSNPLRAILVPMVFFLAWMYLAPKIFPGLQNKPVPPVADPNLAALDEPVKPIPEGELPPLDVKTFPRKSWTLGSLEPDSGVFEQITLTSRGASIENAELNDPTYKTLDRSAPLKVIGNNLTGPDDAGVRTLAMNVAAIDALLAKDKVTLRDVDWELVEAESDKTKAVFRYPSPDGSLVVRKEFRLNPGNDKQRETDPTGYLVDVTLTFENLTDAPRKVEYDLQGPVGLPMENLENTRFYTEVKIGTIINPATPTKVTSIAMPATKVVDQTDAAIAEKQPAKVDTWRDPLRYAGVDTQFFTALLLFTNQLSDTNGDAKPDPYFTFVRPTVVDRNVKHKERSDVSILLRSQPIELAAKGTVTESFQLFLGPKRVDLLKPLGVQGALNFGWTSPVAMIMLTILGVFHHVFHAPYALAIVLLTVVVRGLMFPISRKQAMGAAIMKEISPKLTELKKKYEKEPEKFIGAQRDLFRKYNYNPFAGCLPLFLQLPIFIGLYDALQYSVDLRLAKFLWVDNLAAPDSLFRLPFTVPFLGWTEFNLLPFVTLGLFLVQQKMFMPPPTSDEQALQYKMMNFMMVFMGVMFYRVPAGLCLYFIASSLWGITERKLLANVKMPTADELERRAAADAMKPRKPGFLEKLMAMADSARDQANAQQKLGDSGSDSSRKRDEERKDKRERRKEKEEKEAEEL